MVAEERSTPRIDLMGTRQHRHSITMTDPDGRQAASHPSSAFMHLCPAVPNRGVGLPGGHPVTATNSIAEHRFGKSAHGSLSRTLLDTLLMLYQTNPKILGFTWGAAVFGEKDAIPQPAAERVQSTYRFRSTVPDGPGRRDLLH